MRSGSESLRDDGVDEDGDGLIDCQDADCDFLDGCEFGTELTCDDELDYDDEHFPELGDAFEKAHPVQVGQVGLAECRLFSQKTAVDFATNWLRDHNAATHS